MQWRCEFSLQIGDPESQPAPHLDLLMAGFATALQRSERCADVKNLDVDPDRDFAELYPNAARSVSCLLSAASDAAARDLADGLLVVALGGAVDALAEIDAHAIP